MDIETEMLFVQKYAESGDAPSQRDLGMEVESKGFAIGLLFKGKEASSDSVNKFRMDFKGGRTVGEW